MKLRQRVLIIMGLVSSTFLLLFLFAALRYPLWIFVTLFVCFSLVLFSLFSSFILKRIEYLTQEISEITTKNYFSRRLDISGNDETVVIADKFNELLDEARAKQNLLEQSVLDRNQEIQKLMTGEGKNLVSGGEATKDNDEFMSKLSHYDNLTALPNRIFFNETLSKAISYAKRRKQILAILFVDIDGFNSINVTGGYSTGDAILKTLSQRFKNVLRAEDVIARLDSDEFLILLSDIKKPKFASVVAEKLLRASAEPIEVNQLKYSLTSSIGISIYPNDGDSLEELLKNTDSALYQAKRAKGNNYQFHEHTINSEAREYIQLESALRTAIKTNQLVLLYQPKFDIKKGKIIGVEALIRWEHPDHGVINPLKFIGIAEESGLSMQFFEWTLREACRANKHWQDEGYEHITMAINLSSKQFYHPDLIKIINMIINETNYNPNYLELEINETTVMDDVETANKKFDEIKETGVRLSIDHFGTGYTSISHLKQFPISVLKVDQSFVKGLPHTPNDMAIMNAFIGLAHNLGLEIVAAGVETAEQVQYLASQNCDVIQGYFLSYPLPADKIILQLKKLSEEVLL